jgi:acyl-CoA synthetase (AMP-forming)/AMP-acid ligase II
LFHNQRAASQVAGQNALRIYTIDKFVSTHSNGHKEGSFSLLEQGSSTLGNGPAVLMLTSESTGNAKAVSFTHQQLLVFVAGKSHANKTTSGGSFLNWIGVGNKVIS